MGQKVAGTCYVKVDGEQLVLTGDVEVPLNKTKKDTIVKGYFKEEDVPPFIKVECLVTKGMNAQKIVDGTNMTVTAELANGKVYTLSGAYVVGDANFNSGEGKASLEFNGDEGDWL